MEGADNMYLPNLDLLEDINEEALKLAYEKVEEIRTTSDTNLLYFQCLQLLEMTSLSAEIPRLVVFGQQSMGKTTLLDYIMGGPIGYSSTDTGTKQPVVIMISPSNNSQIECIIDDQRVGIKQLQNIIAEKMKAVGEKISEEELKIHIFVPGGVYAVFVDLPGIKDDSKEGSEFTRSVVRNYVRHNPNDLYILVKKSSDDPANWPWSLREFILSNAPKGLGLTQKQTVVVGTRAREFLENEKSDISSQSELLNRVKKRAVTDSNKTPFPLFLLELHSLPVELKQSGDFQSQKKMMYEQIQAGQRAISELIHTNFLPSGQANVIVHLMDYFSTHKFKTALNTKFQNLLNEQLTLLEKRLLKKRNDNKRVIMTLDKKLQNRTASACRENINFFIRKLTFVIREFLTGNYVGMIHTQNGQKFLGDFGGSLNDNLKEGNYMAQELYPDPLIYNEKFFEKYNEEAEKISQESTKDTTPDPFPHGQIVRFNISRDSSSQLYGLIDKPPENTPTETPEAAHKGQVLPSQQSASGATSPAPTTRTSQPSTHNLPVMFYAEMGPEKKVSPQIREVNIDRLTAITPLSAVLHKNQVTQNTSPNLSCWLKFSRNDSWIGLMPIEVEMTVINNLTGFTNTELIVKSTGLDTSTGEGDSNFNVELKDVYLDHKEEMDEEEDMYVLKSPTANNLSKYEDLKLLNQLSLNYLASWMQLQISNLQPDYKISKQGMLQSMRGVTKVIDKSDWEPLVADLLQANIRHGLLNLTKLTACSSAIALRRIVMASFDEMRRKAKAGTTEDTLSYLADNTKFMNDIQEALQEYCKQKAIECIRTMEEFIFEQTYAIRFEVAQDLFIGCSKYEEEFLGTRKLRDVVKRISQMSSTQSAKSGISENSTNTDDDFIFKRIYEEVRMQFWVTKMLLSVPLSTKIYTHFVKKVIHETAHLASNREELAFGELDLEKFLNLKLLCEERITGNYTERDDTELLEYFEFHHDFYMTERKAKGMRKVDEYLKLAQESISKLRQQIFRHSSVDFLMRLNVDFQDMSDELAPSMSQISEETTTHSATNGVIT